MIRVVSFETQIPFVKKVNLYFAAVAYDVDSQLPAPRYGTTCRLTSQLRRHSRSSDSALRHYFLFSRSYPDIVT